MLVSPLGDHDPRPIHKRRLMPHMLPMAAGQIGHPIPMFVEMVSDNGLVHEILQRLLFATRQALAFIKPYLWALGCGDIGPPLLTVHVEAPQKHYLPIEMPKF